MEEYLGTISVPAIAAVVFFVVKLIRSAVGENAKFEKFVPLMSAGLGIVCGVICFYALPAIIPAGNVVVAIVIGGASGLTAIGTGQMFKQLGKKEENEKPLSEEPKPEAEKPADSDDNTKK